MFFILFSAPPLAIIPLAVREMQIWLAGSPNRVVVLHCKGASPRCILEPSKSDSLSQLVKDAPDL